MTTLLIDMYLFAEELKNKTNNFHLPSHSMIERCNATLKDNRHAKKPVSCDIHCTRHHLKSHNVIRSSVTHYNPTEDQQIANRAQ